MYLTYPVHSQSHELFPQTFEVVSLSIVSYDANWHSTPHYHDFLEIFYCLEGSGFLLTNYGQQAISAHDLLLVNPYIEHTERTQLENPLKYLVIGVKGPEVVLPNYISESGLFYFQDAKRDFHAITQALLRECEQQGHYSDTIIHHLVNAMLLRVNQLANTTLKKQVAPTLSPSVVLAKQYMDNHYSQPITLEDLEARTHISKFHLSHLFKAELGISPINYLISVRFERAKELLTNTNMTILQISESLGFNSPNYFSNKFKAAFKLTPVAYRKLHSRTFN